MSLFRMDLWFPEAIDYPVQLLTRPVWLVDYTAAMIIATVFAVVQVMACAYTAPKIIRSSASQPHNHNSRFNRVNWWHATSVLIAILYIVSTVIYWVVYIQRYTSVTTLRGYNLTEEQTLDWFRANPEHEGVKMICIPGALLLDGSEGARFCTMFKLEHNLLHYKALEVTFATLVEMLILLADVILVYRCYVGFADLAWVYATAGVLFLLSLSGPIMGIIALAKLASLGRNTDPWFEANFPQTGGYRFLAWHSPAVVIATSVAVNLFVTVAIVTRIMLARRKVRQLQLVGDVPKDPYLGISAILVESALPSAVFGVLAAVFPKVGKVGAYININFSPRVLWIAFTALAPQLIIIRVLQGRAWRRDMVYSNRSSSAGRGLLFAPMETTTHEQLRSPNDGGGVQDEEKTTSTPSTDLDSTPT
ncbi:hypothetical protein CC1G_11426 [Coprinopsis cinerea okayama7|uniref:Uncharacterized protein n=1 Tax=Coprinopsis cinerea (strain Okayama-7 / 130 / ATCC MYA-4618 / FGSC 9003) TaxID=240176 RepID=A8N495_COPC7|nr:hypothetical protein CC1G_11426 [Coprinopsis cinerea okayama7\|eukprot:XP_001829690.2 hypothetical protein CC1G_11426 [Coprinopsis cinerea okayama7\